MAVMSWGRRQTVILQMLSNNSPDSQNKTILFLLLTMLRLCGLVVSVEDYKHRGPRFDSWELLRIFLRELGLERGPLSLVIG
jgi:hypothetical protein